MPKDALLAALAAIDAANAADPNSEPDGRPAALVYGQRMSEELARRSGGQANNADLGESKKLTAGIVGLLGDGSDSL